MADTQLRLIPEDSRHPWAKDVNTLTRLFLAINTGGIILRGDLGVRRSPDAPNTDITGRYAIEAQSKASGGLHQAWPLSGTSVTATPTLANSAALMTDTGLALGTTAGIRFDLETLRVYESGRVDYAQLTSLNGELLLTGSGASAGALSTDGAITVKSGNAIKINNAANTAVGQFAADASGNVVVAGTTGNLQVNGNISWLSGGSAVTLDHAATSARTVTFQDLTGTVALLGVANAGGNLTFTDNTYDLGTNGTTARPRTLYLGTSLNVSNGAQLLTATDVTLTAPYTDWSNVIGLTQNGARTFTVDYAYYRIFGKFVHVMACVTCTNAGTAGNTIQITGLPAAIAPANQGLGYPLGTFTFWDQGTAFYHGYAVALSATTIEGISYGATNTMGINAPAPALANTDKIGIDLMYRLA